jgi:hypothetical protein
MILFSGSSASLLLENFRDASSLKSIGQFTLSFYIVGRHGIFPWADPGYRYDGRSGAICMLTTVEPTGGTGDHDGVKATSVCLGNYHVSMKLRSRDCPALAMLLQRRRRRTER